MELKTFENDRNRSKKSKSYKRMERERERERESDTVRGGIENCCEPLSFFLYRRIEASLRERLNPPSPPANSIVHYRVRRHLAILTGLR